MKPWAISSGHPDDQLAAERQWWEGAVSRRGGAGPNQTPRTCRGGRDHAVYCRLRLRRWSEPLHHSLPILTFHTRAVSGDRTSSNKNVAPAEKKPAYVERCRRAFADIHLTAAHDSRRRRSPCPARRGQAQPCTGGWWLGPTQLKTRSPTLWSTRRRNHGFVGNVATSSCSAVPDRGTEPELRTR